MDQLNLNENVDTLFKSLEDFTQKEGIIGKPVTQGDKTFLPVVSITLGCGGGNANMKGQGNASSGTSSGMSSSTGTGAMGLGAKLCTDAVIVIDGQNVSLLPMNAAGGATSIMDKIPQIISGMKGQGQGQNQSQGQGQNQGTQTQGTQSTSSTQTPAFSGK